MEPDSNEQHNTSLQLDETTFACLWEIQRWGYFLSIIGFIGVVLIVLLGLFIGSFLGNYLPASGITPSPGILSMIYLVVALLYFFPVLYLYRFSVNMKISLRESNQEVFSMAFVNMRSLFRFTGIATIIVISLYLVIFLTAIIFSAFAMR